MQSRGFTLVELLIALTIFAVLGVASWKVLHQVIDSKSTLDAQYEQLQQLQKALWLISQDLRSAVDRPIRDNYGTREAAMSSLVPGIKLTFTRNGWQNLATAKRSELRRIAYVIEEDDDGKRLMRYLWPVLDRAPSTEPVKQLLLNPIDRLELQFLDNRGQSTFYWPPGKTDDDANRPAIPSGIRLQITLPSLGTIERVIQLRDARTS